MYNAHGRCFQRDRCDLIVCNTTGRLPFHSYKVALGCHAWLQDLPFQNPLPCNEFIFWLRRTARQILWCLFQSNRSRSLEPALQKILKVCLDQSLSENFWEAAHMFQKHTKRYLAKIAKNLLLYIKTFQAKDVRFSSCGLSIRFFFKCSARPVNLERFFPKE